MTTAGLQLSPQQKHLWSLTRGDDGHCYQARCAVRLEGKLDQPALQNAIEQVVKRHEILRTIFRKFPGLTMPVQVMGESDPPTSTRIDLTGLSSERQEVELEMLFQQMRQQPFAAQSPLSTTLVRLSETQHVLLISVAAACADSITLDNLIRDLSKTYDKCLRGEKSSEAPLQYADISEVFNDLLNSEETETGRSYWQQHDLSSLQRLRLPFENEVSADPRFQSAFVTTQIRPDLLDKLDTFNRTFETSHSVVLLACWQVLLRRLTGHEDLIVGASYDGRSYEGLSETLGLFARCLPIRCRIADKQTLLHVLREIKRTTGEVQEWQDYFRLEHNGNQLGSGQQLEYLPFCFEFENSSPAYAGGEVTFSIAKRDVCFDRFKLKLRCTQAGARVDTELHFDSSLYGLADVEILLQQLHAVLESALDSPHRAVSDVEILGPRELERILLSFNQTATDYPQAQNIQQLFEDQVARTPHSVAVSFDEKQLTYAELNAKANQLGYCLRDLGAGPEHRIGLYMERCPEMLIGILGILKAGACYVPLDPASPRQRLAFIVEESRLSILVTQSARAGITGTQIRTVCLDSNNEALAGAPTTNPRSITTPQNLAYIIYTSGSTGRPKGVMVEHRSVVNLSFALRDTVYANVNEPLRVGLNAPLIFDASVKQLLQLLHGHELHIVPEEVRSDPAKFVSFIERYKLSVFDCTPTQLKALLANRLGAGGYVPPIILVGGEEIDEATWRTLAASEATTYFDVYGPTECTVDSTVCCVKQQPEQASIGRPVPNAQIYILDENLRPVPIGVRGEVCIGGAGLARGYLEQPSLTAEAFIPNPFARRHGERLYKTGDLARYLPDGRIRYLGRKDSQIKLSGYRIELREIETLVMEYPAVQDAAVAVKQMDERPEIVAYIVWREGGAQPDTAGLKKFLRDRLPEYMMPRVCVALPSLPLTSNGKVDHARLPQPQKDSQAFPVKHGAPCSQMERTIARIWQEELRVEKVGIHDNFFDLGGSSLIMVRVFDRLQATFGNWLKMVELFRHPTISTLAKYLSQQSDTFLQTRIDQMVSRQKEARGRQAKARMR